MGYASPFYALKRPKIEKVRWPIFLLVKNVPAHQKLGHYLKNWQFWYFWQRNSHCGVRFSHCAPPFRSDRKKTVIYWRLFLVSYQFVVLSVYRIQIKKFTKTERVGGSNRPSDEIPYPLPPPLYLLCVLGQNIFVPPKVWIGSDRPKKGDFVH